MELILHQTGCNRHIPSSISFIYQDRIASELIANSRIWPKCISINGCEQTDKWKHLTWWNCWNSNSVNDLYHDKPISDKWMYISLGDQSNIKAACLVEVEFAFQASYSAPRVPLVQRDQKCIKVQPKIWCLWCLKESFSILANKRFWFVLCVRWWHQNPFMSVH